MDDRVCFGEDTIDEADVVSDANGGGHYYRPVLIYYFASSAVTSVRFCCIL